eukprot:g5275.t1
MSVKSSVATIPSQLKSSMSVSSRSGRTGFKKRNYVDSISKSSDPNAPLALLAYLKDELFEQTSVGIIGYILSTLSDVINSSINSDTPGTWRQKFIIRKGPNLILALAIRYKTRASIVEPSLSLISTLVGDPVRSKMQFCLREPFKELIVFVLEKHISNEEVMEQTCKAIGYFVAGIPPNRQIQEDFLNIGIIKSVIKVMAFHRESKWVQTEGCGALLLLAFDCPTNRREILKNGGLDAIKIAMDRFPYNIHVSKFARLAKSEVYNLEILSKQHSTKINDDTHGTFSEVTKAIEKSDIDFNNITLNTPKYRKDNIKDGRLSIQVNPTFYKSISICQSYSYSVLAKPEPSIDMMEALAELGANNNEMRNNFMKMGGVKVVIDGMVSKCKNMKVQRNGALVLYFLGKNNSQLCKEIAKYGGIEVLDAAKKSFPNEPYVLRWVRLALQEIKEYG